MKLKNMCVLFFFAIALITSQSFANCFEDGCENGYYCETSGSLIGSCRLDKKANPEREETDQDYCSSSIDCGSGAFCKDTSGGKRCVGGQGGRDGGGNQDYCSSSIDCSDTGSFCKDTSAGKRCVGGSSGGGRQEYCSSSIDCGAGLFCKDSSIGKICL